MHILVFPGWYPCRTDELSGDFIQRHMQAISLKCKVSVVFAVKEKGIQKAERITIQNELLNEHFYYYPPVNGIKWLDNLSSFFRYNYYCLKAARELNKKDKIDIVHLYILQKNHLLGFILKWWLHIPFVVSEQSTIYVDGSFEKKNLLLRKIFGHVFKKATSWHVVSAYLAEKIGQKLRPGTQGIIIPNVVNTDVFFHRPHSNPQVAFVHVSNMVWQKNIEGMLQAFAKVKATRDNFLLNLVGPLPDHISRLIDELDLQENVKTFGQKHYKEVALILQQSDVFIFFTRYETFGCVIIEANACGLPVIVSRLPVTHELISDNKNGLFVENENINDLAEKILIVINGAAKFDPASISEETAQKFNYLKIGSDFKKWYNDCVSDHLLRN